MHVSASFRRWRRLAATVGAFAALGAFGPVGCADADTTHTLTLWHAWGGAELEALKALIVRYHDKHPDIEVMALQVPYTSLKDKFRRSASSNGGPDLLIGDADWAGNFSQSDLLLEADGLFSGEELKRFYPENLKALSRRDHLYALPESRETVVLYYNKRFVPKPPATFEELLAMAPKVAPHEKGEPGFGFVLNSSFYMLAGYYFANGGKVFDDRGEIVLDTPGGRKTLEWIKGISKAPGVLVTKEYTKPDSLYKQGQAAMFINGPWALADYRKILGKDLAVAPLPRVAGSGAPAPWVGVKCMLFNRNSDPNHQKLAHDFALFMTEPESQLLLAQRAGHVPANREVKPPPPLEVFALQASHGTPVAANPEFALVGDPMDRAVEQAIRGERDAGTALSEAKQAIQYRIQEMRKRNQ